MSIRFHPLSRSISRTCATTLIAIGALSLSALAHAEDPVAPAAATASDKLPWVDGTVRKVDTAQGKITLKHGEITNLDMPPMSMVFKVADPSMLEGIKPGDAVQFQASEVQGAYTAVQIRKP
ncbi:copper-binding protein [Hydrogenophaga sp. 5NK40-0174]|uniref:copper-binding protein n=1 Tax=Hydrogenophaga sp. 5NK40-0174 TaxID=3127649 RepID=UPI003103830C